MIRKGTRRFAGSFFAAEVKTLLVDAQEHKIFLHMPNSVYNRF